MPTPTMNPVKRNQKLHNPDSPLLIAHVNEGDVIKEGNEPNAQTRLF